MFSIVAITWFVLAVELTLSWNSVGSVYSLSSTGQLIPFITGLLGLVRSVHLVVMEFLELVCFATNDFNFPLFVFDVHCPARLKSARDGFISSMKKFELAQILLFHC